MSEAPSNPPADTASAGARIAQAITAHRPKLLIIAAAVIGQSDGAEDVLQEAARVALEKASTVDEVNNLPAWLAQVVRHVALNARRSTKRRPSPVQGEVLDSRAGDAEPPASPVGLNGQVRPNQTSFDDRVMAALMELDERARACLMLRVILGLPYKEIAETLGIPEGTAMSHVLRSRRAMAAKLTQESDD